MPDSPVTAPIRPFAFLRGRRVWIVCAVILLSRLLLLAFAQWLEGDDGPRYLREAVNVGDFGVFSSLAGANPSPTAHDLPLYPLLLSGLIALFSNVALALKVAAACNAVFFTAAAAALYGIAALLSRSASVALLATIGFAIFPETLPYSLFYMPDSLFVAVFLWSVLIVIGFLCTGKKACFLTAFAVLGISILVKPASLFFGAVFALWAFLFWPRRASVATRALWIACGLLLEAAVVSPWMLRNQRDFGHAVLTSVTGTNLFRENYRLMLEETRPADAAAVLESKEAQAQASAGAAWLNPVDKSNLLGSIAGREIKTHLGSYIKTTLKRHPRLYLGTGSLALLRLVGDDRDTAALEVWQSHPSLSGARPIPARVLLLQLVSWLILAAAYAAALVGAVALFHRRAWLGLAVPVITLAYFAVLIGPVTYTRYRLPMAPFFALLAAQGILWAVNTFPPVPRGRRHAAVPELLTTDR